MLEGVHGAGGVLEFIYDKRTVLIVNEHVRLAGIPCQAHDYVVNGRTPIEWLIDRYRIVRAKESGIVNDPNGWFFAAGRPDRGDPADRALSVETVRLVFGLPEPFDSAR